MSLGTSVDSIFLITNEFYPKRGGIATFTEEMAKASADLGYKVEVWAQAAPPHGKEKAWPFKVHRLAIKGTHGFVCQFKLALRLINARRQIRYSTVYLPEPGPMLAMMFLQFIPSFRPHRLILTFHGSEIRRFHRNPIIRFFARRLIRNAWRVSTLTQYTRQLLCRHFPEAAPKTLITPGALRTDFTVVETPPARDRNKLVILTVGRIHPRKGQLTTLQALQSLAPQFRQRIEYWIVGARSNAAYEQTLRETAAHSDLVVRFLSDVPDHDLDRIYDCADIFALTSVDHGHSVEGFGLVYLEAAAHGLPVVGHRIGGVSEAVSEGHTGLLVPPGHPAQLTAAFERLISETDLRHRLGHAGLRWAKRNCWKASAKLLFPPHNLNKKPAATAN